MLALLQSSVQASFCVFYLFNPFVHDLVLFTSQLFMYSYAWWSRAVGEGASVPGYVLGFITNHHCPAQYLYKAATNQWDLFPAYPPAPPPPVLFTLCSFPTTVPMSSVLWIVHLNVKIVVHSPEVSGIRVLCYSHLRFSLLYVRFLQRFLWVPFYDSFILCPKCPSISGGVGSYGYCAGFLFFSGSIQAGWQAQVYFSFSPVSRIIILFSYYHLWVVQEPFFWIFIYQFSYRWIIMSFLPLLAQLHLVLLQLHPVPRLQPHLLQGLCVYLRNALFVFWTLAVMTCVAFMLRVAKGLKGKVLTGPLKAVQSVPRHGSLSAAVQILILFSLPWPPWEPGWEGSLGILADHT